MIDPVLQQAFNGRSNATGLVTLKAGASSTQVSPTDASNPGAQNVTPNSRIFLFPATPNAAAEVTTTWISPASIFRQQFFIRHNNNALTDRTFFYVAFYPPVG